MNFDELLSRYVAYLIDGNRAGCRNVVGEALQSGIPVHAVYTELFWPVMAEIEKLYRNHKIDIITEHMATRINRTLVDQLQNKLPRREPRNLRMIITCAKDEPEELGAQMCADLFESDGWEVRFLGGGVPNDEIITMVGAFQPDVLFIYGTKTSGAPDVRRLIDKVRDIQACPKMRIMLSGGIFNRAEGLWEEIGADLFAATVKDALPMALSQNRSTVTRKRRRKKIKQEEPAML